VELMRFGFSDPGRPIGVFLFCGQSGSGKTEMAKELARAVYGSEENLIFLEMGQFNSAESMNIFVGAPPGYIGYGQGKLTNGLRDKPRAVVLFDEVEKANPKVLDALLRFLDEGKIDDPAGPVRDGSQCIVILTSNVGAAELGAMAKSLVGKPNRRTELRRALRKEFQKHKFRVEFLNRNDEVVLFRSLEKDDYVEIARRYLHKVVKRLKQERQLDVDPDPGVAQAIGTYCASIEEGARAVKRLTQRMVVVPVARFALNHRCQPGCRLRVTALHAVHDQTCEPEGDVAFAVGGERSE
jgi:ATP-dependent Clp protease ATP-binding subunit ClpC